MCFIRRAKELGFALKEIKELLSLRHDPKTPAAEVKQRAEAKIVAIEAKIRSLQKIKTVLAKLTSACNGQAATSDCPLFHAFANEGNNA